MSRVLPLCAAALLLASCGSEPKPAAPETKNVEPIKPRDETRRFPLDGQVETRVVENHLLDKVFLPGGTMAHFKKGGAEYDLFVAQFPTATDAAIALAHLEGDLKGAHLIPSFGGYFGTDAGRPIFVFPKDTWIAGVIGLPEKQADPEARVLAAHLN
ncbi:MAG: hypothetical protein LAP40_19685 [Acidobacteriia bacterium]|nr:hypothetical protein [Terriglobia bacterium]